MTTATQQIQSDPARRFADKILARTNNGQDLIDILHNISNGGHNANKNDRVTASNYLVNRLYGKCPKLPPAADPDPDPETGDTDDNGVGALREAPSPIPHSGPDPAEGGRGACPERSRRVTQVEDALNDALGPAPSAHNRAADGEPALSLSKGNSREKPALVPRHGGGNPVGRSGASHPDPETPDPSDPFSIQASIQAYIIEITNDGDTLIDTLLEIARADDDDLTVTSYHRTRATRILTDRFMGTDPNAARSVVCPDCRQRWTTHACSPDPAQETQYRRPVRYVDPEALAEVRAEIQRMKDEGILTPIPNARKIDISKRVFPKS